jgi:hypothetical protein
MIWVAQALETSRTCETTSHWQPLPSHLDLLSSLAYIYATAISVSFHGSLSTSFHSSSPAPPLSIYSILYFLPSNKHSRLFSGDFLSLSLWAAVVSTTYSTVLNPNFRVSRSTYSIVLNPNFRVPRTMNNWVYLGFSMYWILLRSAIIYEVK